MNCFIDVTNTTNNDGGGDDDDDEGGDDHDADNVVANISVHVNPTGRTIFLCAVTTHNFVQFI